MTINGVPNPDLVTGRDNKARWNQPDTRRHGFHNLHTRMRYALSLRAPSVLPLTKQIDWTIRKHPGVEDILEASHFSAFCVVRGEHVIYEAYAPDFGADRTHSIQSITKMAVNLMLGRAVADGQVDMSRTMGSYLPELGSGYADATVRDSADMNVANDFTEDYSDPLGGSFGMETAMGWRLPLEGDDEPTIREFVAAVTGGDLENRTGHHLYKSTNTDALAWLIEQESGKSLREWLIEIVEAAGLEGCYHITCDREGIALADGGACLTARDLARLTLLFARGGEGVDGKRVGDAAFIEDKHRNPGPPLPAPRDFIRYSRQTMTDGTWLGHGGYGGQFALANPDTDTAVVYFSVLEDKDASDAAFATSLIRTMGEVAAR
ncbi:MAG: serine hydrolase [Rhodospirillaceae bacterium]|nr:serine hydrolase [Rhodospirillaceae bacterium]